MRECQTPASRMTGRFEVGTSECQVKACATMMEREFAAGDDFDVTPPRGAGTGEANLGEIVSVRYYIYSVWRQQVGVCGCVGSPNKVNQSSSSSRRTRSGHISIGQ